MHATRKLYLEDQELMESKAEIIEYGEREEDEKPYLVLNKTIFYPQGGGQPWDKGFIETSKGIFKVDEVRIEDEKVYHYGLIPNKRIELNGEVILHVNVERRKLLSAIHTAGHLLDMAVENTGQVNLVPSKGYHFPEGSYVEYDGIIEPEFREQALKALQEEMNRLLQIKMAVTTLMIDKSKVFQYCHRKVDYLKDDEPVRLVIIGGISACPCGGTHLKEISELPYVKIYKLKSKSGVTRISYSLEN